MTGHFFEVTIIATEIYPRGLLRQKNDDVEVVEDKGVAHTPSSKEINSEFVNKAIKSIHIMDYQWIVKKIKTMRNAIK